MTGQIWHHKEKIICPNCRSSQTAIVQHTRPFWTYVHDCQSCGHTIMESEWEAVSDLHLREGQKVWIKSLSSYGQVRAFIGDRVSVYIGEGYGDSMFDWDDLVWDGVRNA